MATALGPLADHLWQSTLVVLAAAVLALAMRRHSAQVRHAIWLAASLKFLVPFAMLTAAGEQIAWRSVSAVQPAVVAIVESVGWPFSSPALDLQPAAMAGGSSWSLDRAAAVLLAIWATGAIVVLVVWIGRWRSIVGALRHATPIIEGRVVDAFRGVEVGLKTRLHRDLRIVSSDLRTEPGVFGWRSPVLLWPRGFDDRLSDAQIAAILAHERAHIRRRDNLTSALHMAVQAVFWFHPFVWWVGARLVDERERACDEDVMSAGSEPHVYAEAILRTCQFFVESPLPCVAGVTGSDLKKRIEQIMRNEPVRRLTAWKKSFLVAAGLTIVIGPICVGLANAQTAPVRSERAPDSTLRFDVASVRPHDPTEAGRVFGATFETGRLRLVNLTLGRIVRAAYGISFPNSIPEERVSGGPEWMHSDRFTIEASAGRAVAPAEMAVMLRNLLADRFKLRARIEPRQLPIFALVINRPGQLGPQLHRSTRDCEQSGRCGIGGGPGRFLLEASPMSLLAESLSELTGRPVFDRTGLDGSFDGTLEWAPAPDELLHFGGGDPNRKPSDTGASLFTALQEQFGLRLRAERGPVDFLVIDSAQKPTEN